jgi:hypothetical protein
MTTQELSKTRKSVISKLEENGLMSIEDVKNDPMRFTYISGWDMAKKLKSIEKAKERIANATSRNIEGAYLEIARDMFALIDILNNR